MIVQDNVINPNRRLMIFSQHDRNNQNGFQPLQSGISKESSKTSKFNCRNGPTDKKLATDCQCTAIYITLLIVMILTISVFQNNYVQRFYNPFNQKHHSCLNKQILLHLPYSSSICVSNCPIEQKIQFKCQESQTLCPISIKNLKYSQLLSLCYKYQFQKQNMTIPIITKIVRSVYQQIDIVLMVIVFVLVYCAFMVCTNIVFANSMVYVWVGIMESVTMILAGACFYRYFGLGHGLIKGGQFEIKHRHYLLVIGIISAFSFMYGILVIYKKRGQLKYMVNLIKLSQVMILDNWYIVLLTLTQIVLFLSIFYCFLKFIVLGLSFGFIDTSNTQPYTQFKPHLIRYFMLPLTLILFTWTYFICLSSSRFLLNCITIQWYFSERIKGQNYNTLQNLTESLKLLYIHFGTICYSALLFFLPKCLFKVINLIKTQIHFENALCDFSLLPCCKYLTVYSHTYVILRSHQFNRANRQCCALLQNVRSQTPRLYDLGDYYSRSTILFFTLFSIGFSYYSIMMRNGNQITSFLQIVPTILITVLATFLGTVIMINLLGFVGDILIMMYELDQEAENLPYQKFRGLSVPTKLKDLLANIQNIDI